MTTTENRPCPACTTPAPDSCGCTTSHAPTTITASAARMSPLDVAQFYEDAVLAAGFCAPDATPATTITAGAVYPFPDPSTGISLGASQNLTDSKEMSEVRRVAMVGFDVDSLEYALLASINHALVPAAVDRKSDPHRLAGASVNATNAVTAVSQAIADTLGPVLLAAASMAPLGRQPIAQPGTWGDETDQAQPYVPPFEQRFDIPELPEFDMVRGLYRDLGHHLVTGDGASAARTATTLADQLRANNLTAGATPVPVYAIDARADRDGSLGAMAALVVEERRRGDLARAQSWAKGLASQLEQEADDAAQAEFDAIVAQRDAELSTDELQARRTKRLVASAVARRDAEYDAIVAQRQAEIASGG